jgi:hypothetical protein
MAWLLLLTAALAGRVSHEATPEGTAIVVDTVWTAGERRQVRYTLDAGAAAQAQATPVRFPGDEAAEWVRQQLVARAAREGWDADIVVDGSRVRMRVRALDDATVDARLDALAAEREAAMAQFLRDRGYRVVADGRLAPDHGRLALQHAAGLHSLAHQLGAGRRSTLGFAEVALGFVQAIPYEGGKRRDAGFRRPASVLVADRGDCDSKAVLYAGLLRAARPDLGVAVLVYVAPEGRTGHAWVAVDLRPTPEQASVRIDGRAWVVAEVSGPRQAALGQVDRGARERLGAAEVLTVTPSSP